MNKICETFLQTKSSNCLILIQAISLIFALPVTTNADVLVQPGYGQPSQGHSNYTAEPLIQRRAPNQRTFDDQIRRYQMLIEIVEGQINKLISNQSQVVRQTPAANVELPYYHSLPLYPYSLGPIIDGSRFYTTGSGGTEGGVPFGEVQASPIMLHGRNDFHAQSYVSINKSGRISSGN